MHSPRLVLLLLLVAAALRAEVPDGFSIQRYHLPEDEWIHLKNPPAMPTEGASSEEVEAFIRKSSQEVIRHLEEKGVTLPKGSLGSLDPKRHTLALRTTRDAHELMQAYVSDLSRETPRHLSWRLQIIEAEGVDMRAMMAKAQGHGDQTSLLDQLEPQGSVLITMQGDVQGGQQTTARQGGQITAPSSRPGDGSAKSAESRKSHEQVLLELDPVLDPGGSIDIHLTLSFQPYATAKTEKRELPLPTNMVRTSVTSYPGQTRLLGVWSDPAGQSSRMTAAFLAIHAALPMPLEDTRIEKLLHDAGEKVLPTPAAPSPQEAVSGLQVQRFKVPPDFQLMIMSEAAPDDAGQSPGDPFASPRPLAGTPVKVFKTARQILEEQEIPFPPGAYAWYIRERHEVVVCNTPECLELASDFLKNTCCGVRNLQFSFHIIEAEAEQLRTLSRPSEPVADHRQAWEALNKLAAEGKARFVRSAWLESKGGQQALHETVLRHPRADPAAHSERTTTQPDQAALKDGTGFVLSVDPVTLDDDMVALDVRLEIGPAQSRSATSLSTSITSESGTHRLIGILPSEQPAGREGELLRAVFVRADVLPRWE